MTTLFDSRLALRLGVVAVVVFLCIDRAAAQITNADVKMEDAKAVAVETGSALTAAEAQAVVNFHNKARKDVGVGPVKWSPAVANVAQKWADHLAETGVLEHRQTRKYGENVAIAATLVQGVEHWYGEIKKFSPGTKIDAQNSQFWHYTQMVWRNTTEIGVGKAVIKKGPFKGLLVTVGNYDPPGNVIGQAPY